MWVFGQVKNSKEFFELFPESNYTAIRTFENNKYLLFPEEHALRLNISKSGLINFIRKMWDHEIKNDQRITLAKSIHGGSLFAFIETISSPPSRCRVNSVEYSRIKPGIKTTSWTTERAKIEIPKGFEENILVKNDRIYEGLSSNFFAVRREEGKFVVETAPDDVILPGTIRKAVIEALGNMNIEVSFNTPHLDEIVSGFICSTSRLFIPISQVALPKGTLKDLEIWNDFTNELKKELLNVVLPRYYLELLPKKS
jgi:branched-subunit amino acid aminotransferase/4-amino-4-deoxychorismate lyase